MVQRKLHADLHLCQASERGSSSWWIWGEERKTWQTECWELGFFRASIKRGRGNFLPFFTTPCPPTFQWRMEAAACRQSANRGWGVWCSVPWRTSMSWPSLIGCDLYDFFMYLSISFAYVYPLAFDSIWVYLNSSFLFRVVEQEWHVVKLWYETVVVLTVSRLLRPRTHTHTYECTVNRYTYSI